MTDPWPAPGTMHTLAALAMLRMDKAAMYTGAQNALYKHIYVVCTNSMTYSDPSSPAGCWCLRDQASAEPWPTTLSCLPSPVTLAHRAAAPVGGQACPVPFHTNTVEAAAATVPPDAGWCPVLLMDAIKYPSTVINHRASVSHASV